MDVSIDHVSAQIQREPEDGASARGMQRDQPRAEPHLTSTEQPELSFMTRRERIRARLHTF
jgi:hypothetical protein